MELGEVNSNQNILYEKNLFSIKEYIYIKKKNFYWYILTVKNKGFNIMVPYTHIINFRHICLSVTFFVYKQIFGLFNLHVATEIYFGLRNIIRILLHCREESNDGSV